MGERQEAIDPRWTLTEGLGERRGGGMGYARESSSRDAGEAVDGYRPDAELCIPTGSEWA